MNDNDILQEENLKKASNIVKIYSNDYIDFSVIEIINYTVKSKNDMPNYLDNKKILTDEELVELNIEIDTQNFIAIVDSVNYMLNFNYESYKEKYKSIDFLYSDDSFCKFTVKTLGNSDFIVCIDFAQVTIESLTNKRIIYSYNSLDIPWMDYECIKNEAKEMALSYAASANTGKSGYYSYINDFCSNYTLSYNKFVKDKLSSIYSSKKSIKNNFEKLKRR